MESLTISEFTGCMITSGQTLENPVTGERFTFTHTAASTGGELLAFDFALRPGGAVPIPHVHPIQTERFEVVDGLMRFRVGLRTRIARPGDVVEVAPGVAHSFANAGPDEARLRVEVRPALAMEDMFAEVVEMAQAGRMTRRGLPRSPLELAVLARKYDQEAHAPLLGFRLQRVLLAPLVFLARKRRRGRTHMESPSQLWRVSAEAASITGMTHLPQGAFDMKQRTTLVLGGTGKTGRRVVERLTARGIPTRVGSRSGEPPFDWEDRSTWAPVLDGVGSAYVSYYPDLSAPDAVEATGSFAELAVEKGVRRLVLLSGRGEPEAERAEEAVRDSGADLTIVRSTWFSQNFSEDYMLDYVLSGELALPAGDTPEPFVDADDIADVAVAALTDDRHIGQLYELTGPRLLTFADAAEEISRAAGREIRYVPVSIEEHAAIAAEQGVPTEAIEVLSRLFDEVLDGRNAHVADGVRRALGREPRDFSDYAREAAATGVWNAPAVVASS